jgi:hypothetical protein
MGLCENFLFGRQLVRPVNQFVAQEVYTSPLTISNSRPIFSLAVEERMYVVKLQHCPPCSLRPKEKWTY